MENPLSKIIPNSTQIPNVILDEWLPRLSDVELRLLLIVVRQTIGWVEDLDSGRRKTEDWISMRQFETKSGKGHAQISLALKGLIEEHRLIEAVDKRGKILNTGAKRKAAFGQIYYRLSLRQPALTLFDRPRIQKTDTEAHRIHFSGTRKTDTTKETLITKENTLRAELAPEAKEKPKSTPKPPSDHKEFIDFFWRATQAARHVKPMIRAQDGRNLSRILRSGVSRETLEQAAIFFLYDPSFKTMSPTISTLLSAGILTGLLNRMKNQPDFWKQLDHYASFTGMRTALAGNPQAIATAAGNLAALKAKLAAGFSMSASLRS